jgi:hypothetical protein
MKFILTISICSMVYQDCSPVVQHPVIFDSWESCVKTAIFEVTNIINMLDKETMNNNQLGPAFKCMVLETI